jgi:hypothetical protein
MQLPRFCLAPFNQFITSPAGRAHMLLCLVQPITTTGDARSKKGAEHAAAEAIYRQLVAEGWWDPEAAPKPKKTGGVVSHSGRGKQGALREGGASSS